MRQSVLFAKTIKNVSEEEKSANARLLTRAGFIDKLSAGVYTFLPLGLRVMKKIENIIREEIDAIGGQEIMMPALHPKNIWDATGRWESLDVLFKLKGSDDKEYALGATHEEVIVPLLAKHILSYKDLPAYVYQIQVKFRNEKRAKSGILRGRQFLMKDLYSFHADEKDLDEYYEKAKEAYWKIFSRVGIKNKTYLTLASGGTFSKYSHEFQTITDAGEDIIYICQKCRLAINKEILKDENPVCPECQNNDFEIKKSIEVGNIFKLGTNYSEPFDFKFRDSAGNAKNVIMGCYGIGLDRLMGTAVEASHDKNGIIWPENISPFRAHLIVLDAESSAAKKNAENLYGSLLKADIEVLYDDRNLSAGVKLKDSDLMGIPLRIVVSARTGDKFEVKKRAEREGALLDLDDVIKLTSDIMH
jgi:prolyl-tRNA synthetase